MGARVWVDSSKAALSNAIQGDALRDQGQSRDEIAAALGIALESDAGHHCGGRGRLIARWHTRVVVVSHGRRRGARASDSAPDVVAKATPPAIQPVDPVASGDCLHAGIVTALGCDGRDIVEALRIRRRRRERSTPCTPAARSFEYLSLLRTSCGKTQLGASIQLEIRREFTNLLKDFRIDFSPPIFIMAVDI